MRILVVEDEQKVARALKKGLEKEQYQIEVVFNGEDGFFKLNQQNFDLFIFNVMLPDGDRGEGRHVLDLPTPESIRCLSRQI